MENVSIFELLQLLEQQELALHRLYTTLAEIFTDYQTFWKKIAEDERQHARWLKALGVKVKEGSLSVQENVIRAAAVRSEISFINAQTDRAKHGELSVINAFSIAMSIENDILEKRFFKVFLPQEKPFKGAIQKLMQATREHREYMRQQFNSVKVGEETTSVAKPTSGR